MPLEPGRYGVRATVKLGVGQRRLLALAVRQEGAAVGVPGAPLPQEVDKRDEAEASPIIVTDSIFTFALARAQTPYLLAIFYTYLLMCRLIR
jgi:hypothetical protein